MGIKTTEHIINYTENNDEYNGNDSDDEEDFDYMNFSYENPSDLEDLIIIKYFEANLVTLSFVTEYMFYYFDYLKEEEFGLLHSLIYINDKQEFINESIKILENFKNKFLDNFSYNLNNYEHLINIRDTCYQYYFEYIANSLNKNDNLCSLHKEINLYCLDYIKTQIF